MSIIKRHKAPSDPETCVFERVHRNYTLDTVPPEVLEMILRFLPLRDVSTTVRLVSRRWSTIATTVLNGAFLSAGTRIESIMKHTESLMPNAKTENDLLACSRTWNALELIRAQYKMLRAVTWRYTHPPKQQKFRRFSFYAGSLLDDLNKLLHRALKHRDSFLGPRMTDPAVTLFLMRCKRFMDFFEKVSERKVNRSALVSGCKVVDVLDCLIEGRQILSSKISKKSKNGTVSMRLKYTMKRAWFTCLEVTKTTDEHSWRDEQRFMYLRLRRLVGSVNEHYFENLHYEHELLLQVPLTLPVKPPPASTYSGHGEYSGQFYYYGNMNNYAYESKFVDTAENNTETEQVPKACFDLCIEIELKCTLELAPLFLHAIMKTDDFESTETNRYQELFLRMSVTCPASMANRLPSSYVWELRSPRRIRSNFR